jgi:hypothetical protein
MAVGLAPDSAVHVTPDSPVHAPAIRRDAAELDRHRVLADALGLLDRARGLVAAGWVQEAFYVVRDRRGRVRPVSPFGLLLLSRTDVVGACLVGAVAHAASGVDRRSRRAPAGYVVDALWSALAERDDRPAVVADLGHPTARAARVRELARWNDEPARRRTEVLDLIDRAVARTVQDAVR